MAGADGITGRYRALDGNRNAAAAGSGNIGVAQRHAARRIGDRAIGAGAGGRRRDGVVEGQAAWQRLRQRGLRQGEWIGVVQRDGEH